MRVESEADDIYDAARKRALRGEGEDRAGGLLGRDARSMDHLEKVIDRLEDVANEIHSIVIEHV